MNRRRLVLIALAIWLALEIAIWSLVVRAVGTLGAVALGLATTALGLIVLKQLGRSALQALRHGLARPNAVSGGQAADGLLTAVGAVLLILPGFVSDIAGLALGWQPVRAHLLRRFAPRAQSRGVIDLDTRDYRRFDSRPPLR